MLIPSNPDKLHACSTVVQDGLDRLNAEGIPYYHDRSEQIAAHAISVCMPELRDYAKQLITIEANTAVSIEQEDDERSSNSLTGIHVGGILRSISIQQIIEQMTFDNANVETMRHDLCAVIVPRYYDPDPKDIVFGKELYVPFSEITGFELRAS